MTDRVKARRITLRPPDRPVEGTVNVRPAARIIVDPNSVVRGEPTLTAARFDDADRVPEVGEVVVAAQPDEDGSNYVGSAEVVRIDATNRLIFMRVDWSSFRAAAATAGCPTYGCTHLAEAHEAAEYADDDTPVRVICTVEVDGEPCPCGQQWRAK